MSLRDEAGPRFGNLENISIKFFMSIFIAVLSFCRHIDIILKISKMTIKQKCLTIAIAGLPNVGKSTLINNIVGAKVSIITPKAQTTRTKIRAVAIYKETQFIFIDVPGIFDAKTKLEKFIVSSAWSAIKSTDAVLLLLDFRNFSYGSDQMIKVIARTKQLNIRCILVINKIDLATKPEIKRAYEHFTAAYGGFDQMFMISALKNDGVEEMLAYLSTVAPEGPWLYPEDCITDTSSSFIAAEVTREKLFLNLNKELPYSLAVVTEQMQEKEDKSLIVRQVIYVLRESHKKIIIGINGENIKKINIAARIELEDMFEVKIHLFLFVKIRKSWQDKPKEYVDHA
ncbi:MAG: GTPase Era [Candidatus Mesenet longicola]|uniref:GTPase Era n=1 Tax=Candidatus Mesenet longicola TaxID=1892558 RepID=A0A8J3MNP6_9RICK|nr:MAG: GTPase Era [Candidatus Mesenet longicola]GHM59105.1 MAG: GTPase Era [Candidatus Mesenet longicola]